MKIEDAIKRYESWAEDDRIDVLIRKEHRQIADWLKELKTDRPQGDVDAVDIFEREMHNLEQGYITLGEFDERIEPLRHLCYGRPQGEWIFKTVFPNDKSEFPMGYLVCSVCGSHHSNSTPCNYCDNCGAQMFAKDINVPNKEGVDDEISCR